MKYLILSKDFSKGKAGDDSGNLGRYFELGWECIGSRFDFIALYNQNKIDEENTTVVTIQDRVFFYTKFYKNVISHDRFLELLRRGDIGDEDILDDWAVGHKNLRFLNANSFINTQTQKYYRYNEDKDLIFNGFDLQGSIIPEHEFVVMCIRHRDWSSNRNSNIDFYQKAVEKIRDKYPIFVVGKGNEVFCEKNNITHIEHLKDYVSLIKNKNCKGLVCQSTGTAVLAFNCAEVDIYLIDHNRASEIHGINAVLGGKPSQFCSGDILPYYDTSDKTLESITERILNV
jgi:hypothetical protein